MKMKYITYEHKKGYAAFVIFDLCTSHDETAKGLKSSQLYGAGFIDVGNGTFHCHGKSTSLKLKPSEADATIIGRLTGCKGKVI